MKMVKSLLLGSAAALVAVTAGQAADLPVKAKPVEYVKVCSLYGAGFYDMPGTDMCIKIGGWVRTEFVYGQVNGSLTWGPFAGNSNNRGSTSEAFRARGYITADAREQTAYGTARAYIDVGINTNDAGLQVANLALSSNRAFLQWAGITAGLTQSFYDFYSVPAASFRGGYYPASDTGDPGWFTWGYTAQLGNGLSATIATEARRTTRSSTRTWVAYLASARLALRVSVRLRRAPTPARLLVAARSSPATVPTAACKPVTSSATSASTRLGAVLKSWPPRMS